MDGISLDASILLGIDSIIISYVQYRNIDIMIEQLQAIDAMESGVR